MPTKPKPTKKPTKKEPFIPGYYCPVCEQPIQPTPGIARQNIWHPECKPYPGSSARKQRICPGCGRHHTLPERHVIGSPSAFCTPECKEPYKAHMNKDKPSKGKICVDCEQPFVHRGGKPCHRCQQPVCKDCLGDHYPLCPAIIALNTKP